MRLTGLSFRGLTCYRGADPVVLDFTAGGLVAIAGKNGAGKTTIIEAVFASLYRRFPSRPGSLYDHCHGRDAFVESVWEDGETRVQCRVLIDAERRQQEAYLIVDGGETCEGGSVQVFDEHVAERFPSEALFLASVFAAQNKAGAFLGMKKGERKALFVEMLGLGGLEELAGRARGRASIESIELERERAVLEAGEKETAGLPALRETVEDAEHNQRRSCELATAAAEAERAGRAKLERAREAEAKLLGLGSAARAAGDALREAERELEDAQGRPDELQLGHEEARRKLRARLDRVRAQIDAAPSEAEARQRVAEAETELARIAIAEGVRAEKVEMLRELEADYRFARQEYEAETKARAAGIERLKRQAKLLELVPCTTAVEWLEINPKSELGVLPWAPGDGKDLADACPLLAEARTAALQLPELEAAQDAGLPARIKTLETQRAELGAWLKRDQDRHELDSASQRDVERKGNEARQAVARAQAVDAARIELEAAETEFAELDKRHAEALEAAEVTLAAARDRKARAEGDAAGAQEALRTAQAELDAGDAETLRRELDELHAARQERDDEARRADRNLATVRARLADMERRHEALEVTRAAIRRHERELGDWRMLAEALGKDGIQAYVVDAAGPEVAELTNELLEATFGPRFSLVFETLREKKTAAGEFVEVFDVRVYDEGAARPVEALSEGERVVVSEAIGLAVAVFNARRYGVQIRTLFRDETAGALDPGAAERYIAMLRRALELGGFDQVVYIAHLPAVVDAADRVIAVDAGTVAALAGGVAA